MLELELIENYLKSIEPQKHRIGYFCVHFYVCYISKKTTQADEFETILSELRVIF